MNIVKLFIMGMMLGPAIIASGQGNFDQVEIQTHQLSESLYMLIGSGGNIGVCVGDDAVLIIDDQYAPLTEKIKAAIGKLSDKPVGYVFNTHWHGDHTGGNENFGKEGAVIIAHKNVRQRLSTDQLMKAFSREVPASPQAAWPVITFTEDLSLHLNEEDILIYHVHNAHTDGDAIVYFPKSNAMHLGDTFFKGRYPFIDLGSGGTVDGMISAANKALFLADGDTKIIPGHGDLATKDDLVTYRDMLMTMRDRVMKAVKSGMTIEEIKTANLSKEYDESWGAGFMNGERFIDIIYTDLSGKE